MEDPVISDANGFYRYDNVPPGTYSVGGFRILA